MLWRLLWREGCVLVSVEPWIIALDEWLFSYNWVSPELVEEKRSAYDDDK